MENNVTIGYALGMVEGYLEGRIDVGDEAAETVLEYLRIIEQGYTQRITEALAYKSKLYNIQMNLEGWVKSDV